MKNGSLYPLSLAFKRSASWINESVLISVAGHIQEKNNDGSGCVNKGTCSLSRSNWFRSMPDTVRVSAMMVWPSKYRKAKAMRRAGLLLPPWPDCAGDASLAVGPASVVVRATGAIRWKRQIITSEWTSSLWTRFRMKGAPHFPVLEAMAVKEAPESRHLSRPSACFWYSGLLEETMVCMKNYWSLWRWWNRRDSE